MTRVWSIESPNGVGTCEGPGALSVLPDVELLRLIARNRNEQAFEVLYNRYERRAHGLAIRCFGQKELAEEAFQEAMLQVWRSASSFKDGSAGRWIFRIVVNECRRIALRSQRRKVREDASQQFKPEADCADHGRDVDRKDDWMRVHAAMNRLTASDRKLAACYYGLGLTQERIALDLGVGSRTVSYRIGRLIARLRKEVGVVSMLSVGEVC